MSTEANIIMHGDCLNVLRGMPDDCVDLVCCSPPYEAARTYGIDFKLRGQEWVDWAVARFVECVRVCRGLVVWVVEGQTRKFRWSATPALLMADLHRAGVHLRKPSAFHRIGIPGSGGPDYWRNDYEFCVVGSKGGKLAWSDNTATGHPPKWAPGGMMSNRHTDGQRKNLRAGQKCKDRYGFSVGGKEPSPTQRAHGAKRSYSDKVADGAKVHTKRDADGTREQAYLPPTLANPGNVVRCKVGGGLMGSDLAHANEAPYPESLVEPFVRCFCPPDGIVLDPFSGSGTTASVAERCGRRWIAIDARESQVELTRRRLAATQRELF